MESVAKFDFVATAPDELSFEKGDVLKVSNFNIAYFKMYIVIFL